MNPNVCEACRSAPIEHQLILEHEEAGRPYRLCLICKGRLENLALRPLEWFNLAAIHSFQKFHLHDDFYDENGTAQQPRTAVTHADRFPAPTLAEASNDPERLLDYVMSRWALTPDICSALNNHNAKQLLAILNERVSTSSNFHIESRAYEVCAETIGSPAADWIRTRLPLHDRRTLFDLSHACAQCLPSEEGFRFVTDQLKSDPPAALRERAAGLAWFRSDKVLDWIETFIHEPLTEDWGRLAAVSRLDWARVKCWLEKSRPLSLVALDALNACWHYNTLLLRRLRPRLGGVWSEEELKSVVEAYMSRDRVPRVQRAAAAVISHLSDIAGP